MKMIPPVRGLDIWGDGRFSASRGNRDHKGVDLACYPATKILAPVSGKVTKIGFPYSPKNHKKKHYRYVEITTDGLKHRLFYVEPSVSLGQAVSKGDVIGLSQSLQKIYKGITDHVHYEIKNGKGFINPMGYLL